MAKKISCTHHAEKRHYQRYEGEEDALVVARKAIHYGIKIHQIPSSMELCYFLSTKAIAKNKKVILLNECIFIFTKNGNTLITMYRIPDEYMDEYRSIKHIEDENKAKYHANRGKR